MVVTTKQGALLAVGSEPTLMINMSQSDRERILKSQKQNNSSKSKGFFFFLNTLHELICDHSDSLLLFSF